MNRQQSVLFLCTGNYYRSRYAEVLFNAIVRKMGLQWVATSRGLAPECFIRNPGAIAKATLAALARANIQDIAATTRAPLAVTETDVIGATCIIALSKQEHEPMVKERYSAWASRMEYWDIHDAPDALTGIERDVNILVASLLGGGGVGTDPTLHAKGMPPAKPPKPITLKVGREIAGRRGKGVTTIFDAPLSEAAMKELCVTLKNKCGTGGTVKDKVIEIQGDQRERIVAELEKLGYAVKRVGG